MITAARTTKILRCRIYKYFSISVKYFNIHSWKLSKFLTDRHPMQLPIEWTSAPIGVHFDWKSDSMNVMMEQFLI